MKKLFGIINISICFLLIACQKEAKDIGINEEVQAVSPNTIKNADPGFVENDMVMYWNEKAALVLNVHTNPGADSRYFAIIEIAVHDALNSITPKYERFALLNEREQFADPDAAVASAAYWTIKGLNIQKTFPIDVWYSESLATISNGQSKELGIALGKKSADAIIANRSNDGFSQVILVSPFPADGTEPGEYRSTLPVSNPSLNLPHLRNVPNWGTVIRPFVVQSNYQFRPAGPYPTNSDEYIIDYNEVKAKGAMVGSTRTTDENILAKFWSDIRHHYVWNDFARNVIATKKLDAWKTARLFALIHTAMADGASAMFEAKYHYYFWSPETAIRIPDDGNSSTINDPTWLPGVIIRQDPNPAMNFYTPGIPEYPSTFGVLGNITGTILQSIIASDEIAIDLSSSKLPDVVLHYTSISKAVSDNTMSKIFSGWQFRKGSIDGEEMGKQISNYVLTHAFREE